MTVQLPSKVSLILHPRENRGNEVEGNDAVSFRLIWKIPFLKHFHVTCHYMSPNITISNYDSGKNRKRTWRHGEWTLEFTLLIFCSVKCKLVLGSVKHQFYLQILRDTFRYLCQQELHVERKVCHQMHCHSRHLCLQWTKTCQILL